MTRALGGMLCCGVRTPLAAASLAGYDMPPCTHAAHLTVNVHASLACVTEPQGCGPPPRQRELSACRAGGSMSGTRRREYVMMRPPPVPPSRGLTMNAPCFVLQSRMPLAAANPRPGPANKSPACAAAEGVCVPRQGQGAPPASPSLGTHCDSRPHCAWHHTTGPQRCGPRPRHGVPGAAASHPRPPCRGTHLHGNRRWVRMTSQAGNARQCWARGAHVIVMRSHVRAPLTRSRISMATHRAGRWQAGPWEGSDPRACGAATPGAGMGMCMCAAQRGRGEHVLMR
jgi:hypothetical protein